MPEIVPGKTGELFGSFIDIFTGVDFRQGLPFLMVAIVASLFCCFEGFRIYKAALAVMGFHFGYTNAESILEHYLSQYMSGLPSGGEVQFMVKAVVGLVAAALAYKFVLAGIFIAAYRFGLQNLPGILDEPVYHFLGKQKLPEFLNRPITKVVSAAAATALGFGATKSTRMVIVAVTAVVGGFAVVNYLQTLMDTYDFGIIVPPASSMIWLYAKLFISAAGVGVQGVQGPLRAGEALS